MFSLFIFIRLVPYYCSPGLNVERLVVSCDEIFYDLFDIVELDAMMYERDANNFLTA